MNTERDLTKNRRLPMAPSLYSSAERQSQLVVYVNALPEEDDGEQDQDSTTHTSFTNQPYIDTHQPCTEDLNAQDTTLENDPELAAIAKRLRATASHAINPTFKENLRKKLLKQFAEYHVGETNKDHF